MVKALVTEVNGDSPALKIKDIPEPELQDHQLLIQTSYAAQNPTDIQSFDGNAFGADAVLGCDFVGRVMSFGKAVAGFRTGDLVAGLIWGGEKKFLGAYSEFTVADKDVCFKVPESVSPEEAVTVPLALGTAWLAFFSKDSLAIELAANPDISILIWGGSSSVGQYAIQLGAKYSFNVITVASKKNFDLCKSLGASHVFDYHDEDVVGQIKEAAPNIKYVFDVTGAEGTAKQSAAAVNAEGGIYCTVRPGKELTDGVPSHVKVVSVLVFTSFLSDHKYKQTDFPKSEDDHNLASILFKEIPDLLTSKRIIPNKPLLVDGGLEGVEKGFQMYRDKEYSAQKIVYKLEVAQN